MRQSSIFLLNGLLAFLLVGSAWSAPRSMFKLKIVAKNRAERTQLAKFIHLDLVDGDIVSSVVNEKDLQKIKEELPHLKIMEEKGLTFRKEITTGESEFPGNDQRFHTYQEVKANLMKYHRRQKALTQVFSIGKGHLGRDIWAVRISAVPKKDNKRIPAILFTGSHHAREHLSTEVPMHLIYHLLDNYGKNETITRLVKTREIYVIPMVNPDGAMYDIRNRYYHYWRKNRRENHDGSFGVDLNRNYSFGWGTGGSSKRPESDVYMGPYPFSEPETAAIKKFVEDRPNIKILLSYHTYSELILYPWGGKTDGIEGKDQEVFVTMAKKMAQWNGYQPMQASDLYVASGDTCDWAYGEHGIFCFTFELTPKDYSEGGFYPGAAVINRVVKANISPALYLIEHAKDPYGAVRVK